MEEQQRGVMIGCSEATDNLVTLGRTRKLMKRVPTLCYNGGSEISIVGSGGTEETLKLKKKRKRKRQGRKLQHECRCVEMLGKERGRRGKSWLSEEKWGRIEERRTWKSKLYEARTTRH